MNLIEQSLSGKLAQEARARELIALYQTQDLDGLMAAAEVLNAAFSQQLTINHWLAKEAADNLSEAWEAHQELTKAMYGKGEL